MTNTTTILRQVSAGARAPRDPAHLPTDKAALRAIAQAAVEVELFTIPLYLTTLYSIQGMHQITSKGNAFYKGRLWPGAATTATPGTANEKAFNIIFSVLIQEMLHLQLSSNMATAIGVTPNYTTSDLQSATHGWTCYGPEITVIPHIVDLQDTNDYGEVKVNLGPVSRGQLALFLAIEQPEADARQGIKPDKRAKYFPKVPFENWKIGEPLPLFGTIGWMYQCYLDYLHLEYTDGRRLWDEVFNPAGQQNDLFNNFDGSGHPMREFMGFESTIALTYSDIAFRQMADMMDAITDQGEGSILKQRVLALAASLQAVEQRYQPSRVALESDYPDFTDTGKLTGSADAVARFGNDDRDHYDRFQEVLASVDGIVTWDAWLKQHGPWTAADLVTPGTVPPADAKIPAPADIAAALNSMADRHGGGPGLSHAVVSGGARRDRRGDDGARQILERRRAEPVAGDLSVPVHGRGRRPRVDLLGGARHRAGFADRPGAARAGHAVPLLPGDRLRRPAGPARHQPVRAGAGVSFLSRFQQLPRPGRLRLRAAHLRRRQLQRQAGGRHGDRRAHVRRRMQSLRRPALFRAGRQQVRRLRRLCGADLGLPAVPEGRDHGVVPLREKNRPGRLDVGADGRDAFVPARRQCP